jgi:hypoxanthine phosphoribosyltransferase
MYYISWNEFESLALDLAKNIDLSNKKYDLIVTVGRGGLLLGRILASLLKLPLGVIFAKTINKKYEISEDISCLFEIKGNVLLVDDLMDDNALLIQKKIKSKYSKVQTITLASIFYKNSNNFKPDYSLNKIKHEMTLIFPYQEMALQKNYKLFME